MDYYQGVVIDYLRATRTRFVNAECLIQVVDGNVPDKGLHWYCDAVVVDLADPSPRVFLCEISYSQTLAALFKRLDAWRKQWSKIKGALVRDCAVAENWSVQPWIFVPKERGDILRRRRTSLEASAEGMPEVKVTYLEDIAPWHYRDWNGKPYKIVDKSALRNE